jgi:hypothetical protein
MSYFVAKGTLLALYRLVFRNEYLEVVGTPEAYSV